MRTDQIEGGAGGACEKWQRAVSIKNECRLEKKNDGKE